MLRIGHVRFYEHRTDRRIGAVYSAQRSLGAKTVCGAEATAWDFTRAEALRLANSAAAGCPDEQFSVCARCAAIMRGGG